MPVGRILRVNIAFRTNRKAGPGRDEGPIPRIVAVCLAGAGLWNAYRGLRREVAEVDILHLFEIEAAPHSIVILEYDRLRGAANEFAVNDGAVTKRQASGGKKWWK